MPDALTLPVYIETYQRRMRGRAQYRFSSLGDAEMDDVMCDVLVKVWRAIDSGWERPGGDPTRWLWTLTRNVAIDWVRRQQREARRFPPAYPPLPLGNDDSDGFNDPLTIVADPAPGPEALAMEGESEVAACLMREWDALPPAQRAVLTAVGLDGMTQERAAVALGMPLGTVKTRMRLGRAKLAHCLTVGALAGVA